MKIVFVSDFFEDQVKGGAEIYDGILIRMLETSGAKVVRFSTQEFIDKHVLLYKKSGFHFIISNFCNLQVDAYKELLKLPRGYSILEHDHKYIQGRDPSPYKDYLAPSERIRFRQFYANAKNIFAQSKIHASCIQRNLRIYNVINLGMSLWSEEQIAVLRKYATAPKQARAAVLKSSNPIKNTHEAVEFCSKKSLEFNLVASPDYEEFIRQLSECDRLVFFPRVLESFNRVLLEARMLGLKLSTNSLNGCTSEDWFREYRGEELINFVEQQREVVFATIVEALQRVEKREEQESDITVILNAYRRPYNLRGQIAAIRNQTTPPKQIWLWVNAHEDNEGFDFSALDVDRVFHNNFNWKFYGRFAAALLVDTEYVAIFDDDTIPGTKWFDNCLNTMSETEGILGSAGVILNGSQYVQHDRCGWPTHNPETTEVDLVGHAWFFKREWLQYLWREKPTTWHNGEDIQFSYLAQKYAGIKTYCPPHPPQDREMHGSVLGNELGIDDKATSTNSAVSHQQFFSERDTCVQTGLRGGWKTVRGVKL